MISEDQVATLRPGPLGRLPNSANSPVQIARYQATAQDSLIAGRPALLRGDQERSFRRTFSVTSPVCWCGDQLVPDDQPVPSGTDGKGGYTYGVG